MLSLDIFHQLLTPLGQQALSAAAALHATDTALLHDLETLRKTFPPELAAAALETIRLRQRARAKFSRADAMYFTREALEQASGEIVARHRAQRYLDAPPPVFDLCCSIGGDALELALAGSGVRGIDLDPLRVAMAEANATVYDVERAVKFQVADVRSFDAPQDSLLFFDPARRRGERRQWRPDDYDPPLSLIERWLPHTAGIGVKVAPGIDYDALPYDCEVEIVSVAGDVKEACLWFGSLRRFTRSATLLNPADGTVATIEDRPVPPVPAIGPLQYLYEPDGAVIRAHLIERLAHEIDAAKIDDSIAFLTSERLMPTPFARAYRVVEAQPFNLKRLRARLRELGVGQVVVKKRGSPIDPQALEKQLRLDGQNTLTVVLTHVLGRPSVILCQPVH